MQSESEKQDLVIVCVFNAAIERVWKAWSDPSDIRQWWGPFGFTAPLVEIDFREGGTSLLCMSSPQHGTHYSTWRYEKIVPMERIDYIHNLADKDGNSIDPTSVGLPPDFPRDQLHTVTFEDAGPSMTKVTVREHDWTPGQMMELSRKGMEQCLEKMAGLFVDK